MARKALEALPQCAARIRCQPGDARTRSKSVSSVVRETQPGCDRRRGGLGGSSAAFHLARRGRRVLLVDRSRFPRTRAVAMALHAPAFDSLTRWVLAMRCRAFSRFAASRCACATVVRESSSTQETSRRQAPASGATPGS